MVMETIGLEHYPPKIPFKGEQVMKRRFIDSHSNSAFLAL
jgi:hypothetical protein